MRVAQREEKVLAAFLDCVRLASADQLAGFARLDHVRVEPIEGSALPFLQQMTHVLVTGDEIVLNFKTHFMFDDVAQMALRKVGAVLTKPQTIDFMKEFCNIAAGKAKTLLEATGMTLGQSLPFSIQGYNEIFYPETVRGGGTAAWRLVAPDGSITCSATVKASSAAVIESLARVTYSGATDPVSGEVELF